MDYEAVLERYKQYRAVAFEINNHTLPELLFKETLETAVRRIGMWGRGEVIPLFPDDPISHHPAYFAV